MDCTRAHRWCIAWRVPCLAAGVTLLISVLAGPAQADLTQMTLTPGSGPRGTTVTISGDSCRKSGGPDRSNVQVLAPTLGIDLTIEAGPNGSWSGTFVVADDAAETAHRITATCRHGLEPLEYPAATFTVVAAPPAPTTTAVDTTDPPPTSAPVGSLGAPTGSSTNPPSPTSEPRPAGTPVAAPGTASTIADPPASTDVPGEAPTTASTATEPAATDQPRASVTSTRDTLPGSDDLAVETPSPSSDGRSTPLVLAAFAIAIPASAWHAWRRSSRSRTRRRGGAHGSEELAVASGEPHPDELVPAMASAASQAVVVLGEDGGWASAKTALEPVDLGAAVLALEAPVRIAVGPDVSVQLDVEPGASVALVGPGDPERLILPLVDNAARALANAGTLRIAVGRGPWAAAADTDATPDWALVVVADTGPGIPGEVLAELRESLSPMPSPVLDDAESPSSLVAINRLVSDLGGHLDISSVAGHGTTVTIALPLHDATSPPIVVLDGPYESVSFG